MRAKTNENTSAIKRLIPAIAMLALSAVTLSTSTYAWFTMGKEVKVEGINMAATASGGIEIALASVSSDNKIHLKNDSDYYDGAHPKDDDALGWNSVVVLGNYYDKVGNLKPASSVNGQNLFYATDASSGGKKATTFEDVGANAAGNNMANFNKRSDYPSSDAQIESSGSDGYYVDIPVHLRTRNKSTQNVQYKMYINDGDESADKELYQAVRVALLKDTDSNASVILGANNGYYTSGQAIASVGSPDPTTGLKKGNWATVEVKTNAVYSKLADANAENAAWGDTNMTFDATANSSGYYHLDMIVRIWLEGESTLCYDSNSGQKWNIGLIFSLPDSTSTPATPTP